MFKVLWVSLGLMDGSRQTLLHLQRMNTKYLFKNSLIISLAASVSMFLGQVLLNKVGNPSLILFQLLSHYITSYLFLSMVLMGVFIFRHKISLFQFIALYLLTDLPLLLNFPISLLRVAFPVISPALGVVPFIIGLCSWILKINLFMKYFRLSITQTIVAIILPMILFIVLGVSYIVSMISIASASF